MTLATAAIQKPIHIGTYLLQQSASTPIQCDS